MKIWRWIYPGLYGLLIYACVRLITDSASRYNVLLHRSVWINLGEIAGVVFVGYASFLMLRWYENKHKTAVISGWKQVFREFAVLACYNLLLVNSTMGVLVALTDNGMDFHDFVIINTIPQLFILVSYSIRRGNYFLKSYVDSRLQLQQIEKDKIEAELSLLKSQYHPHFLFNSLNTIYFQMDESTEEAKKTVEKLSELLRYQLYEEKENKVSLSKELDHIGSYIDLQKVRHSARLSVEINLDAGVTNKKVYPLLFMPLVENAFKYAGGSKCITIRMADRPGTNGEDIIEFYIANSIDRVAKTFSQHIQVSAGGLGLVNLRRRLELLYPGKYELAGAENGDKYEARLNLCLNDN